MYDEDLFFGMEDGQGGVRDEALENFYSKLGEYNSSWVDLEGLYYKYNKVGKFRFTKQVS